MESFFISGGLPKTLELGTYNHLMVIASYAIASFGSYTGLTLALRLLTADTTSKKRLLHWSGAFALGSSIWSMHFIGMLAYKMRMSVHYDPTLTVLSMIVAITVAWFVLDIIQASKSSLRYIAACAVLLGFGISAMHYLGMAAMQMDASLRYVPSLFLLSVIIAIAASGASLWIIFLLAKAPGQGRVVWRILAALLMGAAICGMHYTGMAASVIIPFADCRFDTQQDFGALAIAIIATTGAISILALILGVAGRLTAMTICSVIFALPLLGTAYQAISVIDANILIAHKEHDGMQHQVMLVAKRNMVIYSSLIAFVGFVSLFVFLFYSLRRTESAERAAIVASRAKSDFLANMSHELRTPLNSILGMLRLLLESSTPKEQQELATTAFRSSVNLLEIVNDILDLSKIEAKELKLEHIGFDLQYVLHSVVQTLDHLAREKRIFIVKHYDKEVFPFLLGDPTRLGQVLLNLVGNAIKYTDKGHVEVRAACRTLDESHVELQCEIIDTGIGIAEEKHRLIFEKFSQADSSTTRRFGGTGLGLTITKQLVELMGGSIGVQSELGHGSTFWFRIPFEITDWLSEDRLIRKLKIFCGIIPPKEARILVAEDHPMNQLFAQKLLRRFGIGHFEVVENGVEAVNAYQQKDWDIILMDCHMPHKSGYEATKDIRDLEKTTGRHVPIIAMTANAMVGDREKCLRYGMDEYISKPINVEDLKDILSQWLRFPSDAADVTKDRVATSPAAPLDLSQLRGFTQGDKETEKELIDMFIAQSDKNIALLKETSQNIVTDKAWVEAAHMFKGGAGGIGADALRVLCDRAQHFEGTPQERSRLFDQISLEYDRVKAHLRELGLFHRTGSG